GPRPRPGAAPALRGAHPVRGGRSGAGARRRPGDRCRLRGPAGGPGLPDRRGLRRDRLPPRPLSARRPAVLRRARRGRGRAAGVGGGHLAGEQGRRGRARRRRAAGATGAGGGGRVSEEPLTVEVDPRSPVPPYEQIRTRLLELVRTGALAPGTRLPPIRQLAGDLGVAPNTVARAYRELEAAGVLSSRRRHGTTVTPEAAERARPEAAHGGGGAGGPTLEAAARAYLERARRLGRTLDEAVEELRRIGGE